MTLPERPHVPTTAAALVAFRNELIEGGFPEQIADDLALRVAPEVASVGLCVRDTTETAS